MWNPNCVVFTVQEVLPDGNLGRTVGQSILTVNLDSGKSVPKLREAFEQTGRIRDIVDQESLNTSSRYIVCDSIESNPNFAGQIGNAEILREIYEDFFSRYLGNLPDHLSDGYELVKDQVFVSNSFPGPFASQYKAKSCLLYTSPSPRDKRQSRMPSSA